MTLKVNENLPSSTGNSMYQDDKGNSPQCVSGVLPSLTSQGNNGNAHWQTDKVLLSPTIYENSSKSKNGCSSTGAGNPISVI